MDYLDPELIITVVMILMTLGTLYFKSAYNIVKEKIGQIAELAIMLRDAIADDELSREEIKEIANMILKIIGTSAFKGVTPSQVAATVKGKRA